MQNKCYEKQIKGLLWITIIANQIQTWKMMNLFLVIYVDQQLLEQYGLSDRLSYPKFLYFNTEILIEEYIENHSCYKLFSIINLILQITLLIVVQKILYNNINGQCKIGNNDTTFAQSIIIMFLIVKYIHVGIPLFLYLIYLLFNYFLQIYQTYKYNQQLINSLQIQIVNDKNINNYNKCIICLQDFKIGEQYINLQCHQEHSFHKQCIINWLKIRSECPQCRQIIKI